MAFLQWRRFNFFYIQKDKDSGKISEVFKDIQITVCEGGQGRVVVGDAEGNIHLLTRQLEVKSFKAYQIKVTHLCILKQNPLLISLGEDEPGVNPLVKVWNLDKLDRSGNPVCVRLSRAIPGNRPEIATALAVHENMNYIAVGFQDGSVILYKGDVMRDRSGKPKIIHVGSSPVTRLAFRTIPKGIYLFSVHRDDAWALDVSSKDKEKIKLDSHGASSECVIMTDGKHGHQVFIAKKDAIYCYTTEGRGACYAFEGDKLQLHWFRGHLVMLTKETGATTAIAKPSSASSGDNSLEKIILTIYDMENKLIAYSAPVKPVQMVVSEWGHLYLFHSDGRVSQLAEKDTRSKLEVLFRKNLYDIAIKLAKSQQLDSEDLMDIFRQYGDHLYSKGYYNEAIDQYIHTIGKLEAAYVIRKFLDSARIHNLSAYLEALHKKGLANEDHTTLLLNCYTKLRDTQKLDHFIMNENSAEFDVEIALKVCRQAGYFKHALWLAEKHKLHEIYLKIQLEDNKDYKKALKYLSSLPHQEIEMNLKKYGTQLVENVPDETTSLLKRECASLDDRAPSSNPQDFLHLFINAPDKLKEFLEHVVKVKPNLPSSIFNTLLEMYLNELSCAGESEQEEYEQKVLSLLQDPSANYDINQALTLCRYRNFDKGMLLLYDKYGMYNQVLQYYMRQEDWEGILTACGKFSIREPGLWLSALRFFAKSPTAPQSFLEEVLSHVEKENLLPPLLVLNILFQSSTATLGSVRGYIMRILKSENEHINENKQLIADYKEDTQRMKSHVHTIQTSATVFQASKCHACNHPLELPSVHFLCQHSFHQHCFESYADNESECPVCLPDNKKILDLIKAQELTPDLYEHFHTSLERAEDGFSVIADYFGRDVFSTLSGAAMTQKLEPTLISAEVRPRMSEEKTMTTSYPDVLSEARVRNWESKGGEQTKPSVPLEKEGRLRLQEGKKVPSPFAGAEGRIRLNEGESLQANIMKNTVPKRSPTPDKQQHHASIESHIQPTKKEYEPTKNPFEEDYDESKNPFADEDSPTNPFQEEDDKNPFKDYNDSLNPFSEN